MWEKSRAWRRRRITKDILLCFSKARGREKALRNGRELERNLFFPFYFYNKQPHHHNYSHKGSDCGEPTEKHPSENSRHAEPPQHTQKKYNRFAKKQQIHRFPYDFVGLCNRKQTIMIWNFKQSYLNITAQRKAACIESILFVKTETPFCFKTKRTNISWICIISRVLKISAKNVSLSWQLLKCIMLTVNPSLPLSRTLRIHNYTTNPSTDFETTGNRHKNVFPLSLHFPREGLERWWTADTEPLQRTRQVETRAEGQALQHHNNPSKKLIFPQSPPAGHYFRGRLVCVACSLCSRANRLLLLPFRFVWNIGEHSIIYRHSGTEGWINQTNRGSLLASEALLLSVSWMWRLITSYEDVESKNTKGLYRLMVEGLK